MTQKFADNCRSLLTASILATDTILTVEASKADRFPIGTTTTWSTVLDWFKVVLIDSSGNREVIKVGVRTSASGVLSNILRAQDGTTALAFTAGSVAICPITAADIEALAASGANSDITSLVGLTTPLSISQGGTASTSAVAARAALGVPAGSGSSITGNAATATKLAAANWTIEEIAGSLYFSYGGVNKFRMSSDGTLNALLNVGVGAVA